MLRSGEFTKEIVYTGAAIAAGSLMLAACTSSGGQATPVPPSHLLKLGAGPCLVDARHSEARAAIDIYGVRLKNDQALKRVKYTYGFVGYFDNTNTIERGPADYVPFSFASSDKTVTYEIAVEADPANSTLPPVACDPLILQVQPNGAVDIYETSPN